MSQHEDNQTLNTVCMYVLPSSNWFNIYIQISSASQMSTQHLLFVVTIPRGIAIIKRERETE